MEISGHRSRTRRNRLLACVFQFLHPGYVAQLRSGLRNDINRQLRTAGEPVKYEEIQVEGIYAVPYENCFYRVVVLEKIASSKSLVGHSVNGVATAAAVDEDCPTLPSVLTGLRAISSLPP
ncbi:hypothetical protein CpipJ_CPIJ016603 [Culex quinquefasciatus]|uniref:Uncharacterized protein n=1 Tax=Culex quinquefasciatus TaxID=7176 RepID=B0XAL6_CULQU|nr:hypothetical protein CpipJ_CPIJ016603 [Culex quinquefasciatus]|eukprot:XP_001866688.1 hypothetical protein CpipJ_CPIJ016603 [Culex quinquefasciatus]